MFNPRWSHGLSAALALLPACASGHPQAPQPMPPLAPTFRVETELADLPPGAREVVDHLLEAMDEFPRDWPATDPSWAGRAAAGIEAAAEVAGDANLERHLWAAHGALVGAESGQLEMSLLHLPTAGVIASLFDPSGTTNTVRALQLGLVDRSEQAWLDHYLAHLAEFEAWLGWEGAGPRPPRNRSIVANLIRRVGDMPLGSMHTRLPADAARRSELGSLEIFWKTMTRERWYTCEVLPAARMALVAEDAALATARGHLSFYVTRFAAYQLGPQKVGELSLRERFTRELWGPLVIAKADLLGTLVQEWLIEEGIREPEVSAEALTSLVAMSFRAVADVRRDNAPAAHGLASSLILNRMFRGGGIQRETGDRWSMNLPAAREVARELALEILAIHESGDVERARRLLAEEGHPLPELEPAIERVTTIELVDRAPEFVVRGR